PRYLHSFPTRRSSDLSTIKSEVHSIFDYLYKGYEEKRRALLSEQKKKSVFDSENLMYALIREVLSDDQFSKYGVILHHPLRNLRSEEHTSELQSRENL